MQARIAFFVVMVFFVLCVYVESGRRTPVPPASSLVDGGGGGGRKHRDGDVGVSRHSVHSLHVRDIDDRAINLAQYAGRVLLIVNIASHDARAGRQLTELEHIYKKYKAQGLEILAFPCDQFGHNEAGSNAAIKHFLRGKYHLTFPLMSKVEVNGPHTDHLFQLLKQRFPGPVVSNFGGKWVVGKDGIPRKRSRGSAMLLQNDIEKALAVN